MAAPRIDVISIGTLSRNRIWGETEARRTPHATTTLIRSGKRVILIDPALPPTVLGARLQERTGVDPRQVDTVFLTNFKPSHRGGLTLFKHAKILIHENEQASAEQGLQAMIRGVPDEDEDHRYLTAELDLLQRLTPAPDKLADGVELFPLFGYTPGTCGLIIGSSLTTLLIAGDAVPTLDHFLAGQVLPDTQNIPAAQESLREVYEIADMVIPGHDNLFLNPRAQGL